MLLFIILLNCGLGDNTPPQYNTQTIQESKARTAQAASELAAAAEKLESYIDQARRDNISESAKKDQMWILIADVKQKEARLQQELSDLKSSFKVNNHASEQ